MITRYIMPNRASRSVTMGQNVRISAPGTRQAQSSWPEWATFAQVRAP